MKTVNIQSYAIEIEKYKKFVNMFFRDAKDYVFLGLSNREYRERGMDDIKKIQELVGLLIEERKTGFNPLKLDEIVMDIRAVCVSPLAFEKPKKVTETAMIAFRNVVNGICDYFSKPAVHGEMITKPLTEWLIMKNQGKLAYRVMSMSWVIKKEYDLSL